MSAKETAISDIKSDLHSMGKVFLEYNPKLDSIIKRIVGDYTNRQDWVTCKEGQP